MLAGQQGEGGCGQGRPPLLRAFLDRDADPAVMHRHPIASSPGLCLGMGAWAWVLIHGSSASAFAWACLARRLGPGLRSALTYTPILQPHLPLAPLPTAPLSHHRPPSLPILLPATFIYFHSRGHQFIDPATGRPFYFIGFNAHWLPNLANFEHEWGRTQAAHFMASAQVGVWVWVRVWGRGEGVVGMVKGGDWHRVMGLEVQKSNGMKPAQS